MKENPTDISVRICLPFLSRSCHSMFFKHYDERPREKCIVTFVRKMKEFHTVHL